MNTDWMSEAACKDMAMIDPAGSDALFFPESGPASAAAVGLCQQCPVLHDCQEYSLELAKQQPHDLYGLFGGLTRTDRERLLRPRVA